MRIVGHTVGTPLPKPDWNQTDPNKGDYIKNKPDVAALQALVGDTSVAEQIHDAIANYYTKAQIDTYEFITVDDIDAICGTTIQVASGDDSEVTF